MNPIASESNTETGAPRAVVVIPVLAPAAVLVSLAAGLVGCGLNVLVVDDGSTNASDPAASSVLEALRAMPQVLVLEHAINFGKGAALKTAFRQLALQQPVVETVVTAAADGRHGIEDILAVARAAASQPDALVLGVRRRAVAMPMLFRWRKWLLEQLFWLRTRRRLHDPLTGLRGLPRDLMLEGLTLHSNGYDFDAALLRRAVAWDRPVIEMPIATCYDAGIASSRFRPWRDGFKVLARLIGRVERH